MFKIVSGEEYDKLVYDSEYWKEYSSRYRELYSKQSTRIDSLLKDLEKEKSKVSSNYEFTGYRLSIREGESSFYEIVKASDGTFLVGEGYKSVEEATDKAKELAVAFPAEKFLIYGPLVTVHADIPVITQEFKQGD